MSGRKSGPGAVIEKLAKANCEQEITENGVVQAGKEQRTGGLVSEGEEEPANHAETHGQPISENNVNKPERQGTRGQNAPAAAEERLVAMKEERPVKKFLRVDRKKRVEKKNERPEPGRAPDKGEEKLWSQEVNGDSKANDADGISNKDGGKEWTDVAPVSELRQAERGITSKDEKGQQRRD